MHQKHIDREETANMVEFLASDKANHVAGSTVFVDGGMTLYPAFDLSFHPGEKQEDADK
jgi:glucose 1-dehydrogenase